MRDAWIYARHRDASSELANELAELGFSPRHVEVELLMPRTVPGTKLRQPSLAVVVGAAADPPPFELCVRLGRDEVTRDVPLLVALPSEHLEASSGLTCAHELIVQPYSRAELRARIARINREWKGVDDGNVVRVGSLALNLETYQVTIGDEVVSFAFMEYCLLKFLITHPGRFFSREALLRSVWGFDYYGGARTVDVHVRRVRAKLGNEHAARIGTVRSVGYRFDAS
jgi:DNA-binding response OmpR family regulator